MKGVRLAEITWLEAKEWLNEDCVVVLPIGGGTKEHGPHLPCGTDFYVIEEVASQLVEQQPILLLPTLPYAYYPAFVDWPGSVSIEADHFKDFVTDILVAFIRQGIHKCLILDGGVSTHYPLVPISYDLHNKYGVTVAITDILGLGKEVSDAICEQKQGGHADEAETATMLAIKPELVHMNLAVEEYSQSIPGAYHNGIRKINVRGKMTTKNGTNGNSKLATVAKGEQILSAKVNDILEFLRHF